jgi:sugar (pentulose or hexulose) kinase
MKALALDLGASGGKLLSGSFDGKKLEVKEIHRFMNQPVETRGHLYWDIPGIYSNLLDGLRKAVSEKFSSFSVDSFCNDYGLLDAGGNMVSPVYMYRDCRTDGVLEWMDQLIPPKELFERTGCQRTRFNTLVQLASQTKASDHDLLETAKSLLFVPDLLNYFLCGEKATEYTIASVSQLYNRRDGRWDPKIIRTFDIPEGIFPGVVPSASKLGEARPDILDQTGVKPFSICTVGHHDTASAVVAVPSLENHFAYISSGTWSLMGTETGEMITSDPAFQYNFANEGGVGGRNRFLKNIMGLWLIQECQRQFASHGIVRSFEELDEEAEIELPFRSIIDPDDTLFIQPGDMISKIKLRCQDWNQPIPETVGEITRCIMESLALAYRATLEKLEEVTGFNIPCVYIIGGGARSSLLNQFAASAMQRPIFAGPYEAAAIGNLCTQFISAGEIEDLSEARRLVRSSFNIHNHLPEKDSSWDDAYDRFLLIKNDNK